jgi:hypothetical protein
MPNGPLSGQILFAPTFDISLSSPTTNFHVGFASELLVRNLQLVYGASLIQETRLAGTTAGEPVGVPGTLLTAKKANYGGFFGFTFNISGFIQSLIP